MFDHVYILAKGQCVYQGEGTNIVPYVHSIGLSCPLTYNPADFVIEVSSGEYGLEFVDKMVQCIDNGRVINWTSHTPTEIVAMEDANGNIASLNMTKVQAPKEEFELEIDPKQLMSRATGWQQFKILHHRMTLQMYRDSVSQTISFSFFHLHQRYFSLILVCLVFRVI
jgi:ATP-binding cassette, subfamily G (WHITE), member 1